MLSTNKLRVCGGRIYEKKVYHVCKQLISTHGVRFCTLQEEELGGTTSQKDLECNFYTNRDVGIEIKKYKAPDWMQLSIYPNTEKQQWTSKGLSKIPKKAQRLLEDLLKGKHLYLKDPPFLQEYITYEEWLEHKSDFADMYLSCPPTTIAELYKSKGCQYIQVSKYGLYHTGVDTCSFGVPYFQCPQRLRIRIKIHKTRVSYGKNKGKMIASVIVSPQPVLPYQLEKSPYSLDNIHCLPKNLFLPPSSLLL